MFNQEFFTLYVPSISIKNIISINNMLGLPHNETTLSVKKRFENLLHNFYIKYNDINFDPSISNFFSNSCKTHPLQYVLIKNHIGAPSFINKLKN
jgi:hypothetical protein